MFFLKERTFSLNVRRKQFLIQEFSRHHQCLPPRASPSAENKLFICRQVKLPCRGRSKELQPFLQGHCHVSCTCTPPCPRMLAAALNPLHLNQWENTDPLWSSLLPKPKIARNRKEFKMSLDFQRQSVYLHACSKYSLISPEPQNIPMRWIGKRL